MIRDIKELDDKSQRMRVTWDKANNYFNTFSGDLLEVADALSSGRYGNDWTLSKWLLIKVGIFERSTLTILKAHQNALADDQREKLAARERERARERAAAQAAAEAAAREAAATRARERAAALAAAAEARAQRERERQAREAEKKRQKAAAASRTSYKKRRDAATAAAREAARKAAEEAARKAAAKAAQAAAQTNPRLGVLLAECAQIEKTSRVELGRRYAEMREIVEAQHAGINPATGEPWLWDAWREVLLQRSWRDTHDCIAQFMQFVNDDSDNVVPIRPANRAN